MTIQFNFDRLKGVYFQALGSPDKSLAFEVRNGNGRFLFMMFLSNEDKDMRDALFIYMRNTKRLIRMKTYGSHRNGNFTVYIGPNEEKALIDELGLRRGPGTFDFEQFLAELNRAIPDELDQREKIDLLRKGKEYVPAVVDEALKTELVGPRKLNKGTPQDKTLRKLFLYTDYAFDDVKRLVEYLKATNTTVAWTTPGNAGQTPDIFEQLNL